MFRSLDHLFRSTAFMDPLFGPCDKTVPSYKCKDGVLTVDLPGVKKEDVQLTVEPDRLLRLFAKRGETRYEGVWELANVIDTAGMTAKLADGVLTVQLPGKATSDGRTIQVE